MTERRVWLAQCLCPQRHAIAAVAGEADDKADAEARLLPQLEEGVEKLVGGDAGSRPGNPWCGLCGADRETWHIEVFSTPWQTLEEAAIPLADVAIRQLLTSTILGTHGPQKPGRA